MMIFEWFRQWRRQRESARGEQLRLERASEKAQTILKAMAEGRVIERPRSAKGTA